MRRLGRYAGRHADSRRFQKSPVLDGAFSVSAACLLPLEIPSQAGTELWEGRRQSGPGCNGRGSDTRARRGGTRLEARTARVNSGPRSRLAPTLGRNASPADNKKRFPMEDTFSEAMNVLPIRKGRASSKRFRVFPFAYGTIKKSGTDTQETAGHGDVQNRRFRDEPSAPERGADRQSTVPDAERRSRKGNQAGRLSTVYRLSAADACKHNLRRYPKTRKLSARPARYSRLFASAFAGNIARLWR